MIGTLFRHPNCGLVVYFCRPRFRYKILKCVPADQTVPEPGVNLLFCIGPHRIISRVLLAPMAGVSDAPFRTICQQMGAGLTTSEMLTADTGLWRSRKSSLRLLDNSAESAGRATNEAAHYPLPRSIQIVGGDASAMANAARTAVDSGAELVDINMGCPAKKVCNKAAGSALLRDEDLVREILHSVVKAVEIPVTLKIRTGWCPESRNAVRVARIAEAAGIQALAVHGRTRACRFAGSVEYETVAAIVRAVDIPVIANGDIDSPQKAREVLDATGANAVMIGRGAQGQPWLIREIDHYLDTGCVLPPPSLAVVAKTVAEHLSALYRFYGDYLGLRIARKHVKWYLQKLADRQITAIGMKEDLQAFNKIDSPDLQHAYVQQMFERLITKEDIAA